MNRMNVSDLKRITSIQLKTKDRQKILSEFKNIEGLCRLLNVNQATGLVTTDTNDMRERAIRYGVNDLPRKKSKAFIDFIWQALHDRLLIVLIICALITIIISLCFEHKKCICYINNLKTEVEGISYVAILL